MRTKVVKVNEKDVLVVEKRINELKKLSQDLTMSFDEFTKLELDGKTTDDVFNVIFDMLIDKLTIIFPTLTSTDIENAYMSELEELLLSFIDINFTGAKKVISSVMKLR